METEKKQGKKKVNRTLVTRILKGNTAYLVLGAVFLLVAVMAAYCGPLVTSFTVDYVIDSKESNLPGWVMGWIEHWGGREFLRGKIWICALALIACTLVNGFATYLRRRYVALASEGVAMTLRNALYSHLQNVPYDYHKHVSTGDLVQRCTSDVDTVRRFISVQLLEIVRTVAMVTVACYIMFSTDVRMALISMVLLPVLCVSSFLYFKKVRSQFTLSDEAEGKLSATLQENLAGVRVVRAFGQQRDEVEKFTACNADFRDKTFKLTQLMGIYWGASDAVGYTQIALTLFTGILFVVKGKLTLGSLMMFTTYAGMLTWPVRQLGRVLADLGKATVSLGRIDEILSVPEEQEPGRAEKPAIRGRVEFRNVCFGYDTYDDVLHDISFTARPGEVTAIVGSTGCGKSTLLNLIPRFYDATGGTVSIGGVNVRRLHQTDLRAMLGYVPQKGVLFTGDILSNLEFGGDVSEADAIRAAATAQAEDFIWSRPHHFLTPVAQGGANVSGGQRQRLSIARAIARHPQVYLFDDSFSALDYQTDAALRQALAKQTHDATVIIVAQRLSTILHADQILVLDGGRIVGRGTHSALLRSCETYREIALSQLSAAELGEEG